MAMFSSLKECIICKYSAILLLSSLMHILLEILEVIRSVELWFRMDAKFVICLFTNNAENLKCTVALWKKKLALLLQYFEKKLSYGHANKNEDKMLASVLVTSYSTTLTHAYTCNCFIPLIWSY